MQLLHRLWSFVLVHGLLFLASAAIFLYQPESSTQNQLFVLSMLLLAAGVFQAGIVFYRIRKSGWKNGVSGGSLVVLIDLALGFLILQSPEESLRIFILILAVWSGFIGLSLLFHFGVKKPIRASMAAAGIGFMLLSVYLFLFMDNAQVLNYQLLGILTSIFSVFLIYVAFQLRAIRRADETENRDETKE